MTSSKSNQTTTPLRNMMWPEKSYKALDRGIRFAVRVLHAAGFETCQSCQGGKGHAYDRPTIDMLAQGNDARGFGALDALRQYGLLVDQIAIVWQISAQNGLPYEKLWRITFAETMEARADEPPSFVFNYRAQ